MKTQWSQIHTQPGEIPGGSGFRIRAFTAMVWIQFLVEKQIAQAAQYGQNKKIN